MAINSIIKFKPFYYLLVFICLQFFSSCSKIDISEGKYSTTDFKKLFYDSKVSNNPQVNRIKGFIQAQDEVYNFSEKFAQFEGVPWWSNSIIVSNVSFKESNRDEGDTTVLIPVIPNSENYVKDIIACSLKGDSIDICLIQSDDYENYGYHGSNDGIPKAKDIAELFMIFEKEIYDRNYFEFLDFDLAKKMLGEDIGQDEANIMLLDDGTSQLGFYRLAHLIVPWVTLGGVTVVGYIPSQPTGSYGSFIWWLQNNYNLSSTFNNTIFWWNINNSGGGGSSTGTTGTSTPGWQAFPCGMGKIGDVFFKLPCNSQVILNPGPSDEILTMLKTHAIAIKADANRVYNEKSNVPDASGVKAEWGYIIVRTSDGVVKIKNERTDGLNWYVKINYYTSQGEFILGEEHTHPDEDNQTNPVDRSAPTMSDVLALRKNRNKLNYYSFINCGNKRYALVIEDVNLATNYFNRFSPQKDLEYDDEQYRIAKNQPNWYSNWQNATQVALLTLIGISSTSGIGVYETDDNDKTNFIKLN